MGGEAGVGDGVGGSGEGEGRGKVRPVVPLAVLPSRTRSCASCKVSGQGCCNAERGGKSSGAQGLKAGSRVHRVCQRAPGRRTPRGNSTQRGGRRRGGHCAAPPGGQIINVCYLWKAEWSREAATLWTAGHGLSMSITGCARGRSPTRAIGQCLCVARGRTSFAPSASSFLAVARSLSSTGATCSVTTQW